MLISLSNNCALDSSTKSKSSSSSTISSKPIISVAIPKHFIWKNPPTNPPTAPPIHAPNIGRFKRSVTP